MSPWGSFKDWMSSCKFKFLALSLPRISRRKRGAGLAGPGEWEASGQVAKLVQDKNLFSPESQHKCLCLSFKSKSKLSLWEMPEEIPNTVTQIRSFPLLSQSESRCASSLTSNWWQDLASHSRVNPHQLEKEGNFQGNHRNHISNPMLNFFPWGMTVFPS